MSNLRFLALATVYTLVTTASLSANSYTVKSGDTIHAIARRNGISVRELMLINRIEDPTKLRIGQALKLSATESTPKKAAKAPQQASGSSSAGAHTVQAGDTLYSIARRHGVSVNSLTAMNPGLNPSGLKVGQKISLTASTKPKSATESIPAAPPKAAPKPGQTLAKAEEKVEPKAAPKAAPKPKVTATATAPKSQPTSSAKPASATKFTTISTVEKTSRAKAEPIPQAISTVVIEKEIAFGTLASQHRTTIAALNALNGWDLKATAVLARGSEIYIPLK